MRADLSEHAVAMIGRVGCGVLSQVRALQVGERVARGEIDGMVEAVRV